MMVMGMPSSSPAPASSPSCSRRCQIGTIFPLASCIWRLTGALFDAHYLQEIIASQPDLVPSSVLDLSSGGQLPLHLAAAAGSVGVLRLLLAAGADVRATNGTGETPLQVMAAGLPYIWFMLLCHSVAPISSLSEVWR